MTAEYLMWKMGFDPIQFDDSLALCHTRIRTFRDTLLSVEIIENERDREIIREAGVNLFVSIEEFIAQLLQFSVWTLASDHFLDTDFKFDRSDLSATVAETLGTTLASGDTKVTWYTNGNNPLGVLLRYLDESLIWMENLSREDRSSLQRKKEDLPNFADDKRTPFPLRHRALWADADPSQLTDYVSGYRRIVKLINQARLAPVRNGLDHHRAPAEFPELDMILACATRLDEAVTLADVQRYFPNLWWVTEVEYDRHLQSRITLTSYSGSRATVFMPFFVAGLPDVPITLPCILPPGNLLGYPNSQIVFGIRSRSTFAAYWSGYPRRRRLPPKTLQLAGTSADSGESQDTHPAGMPGEDVPAQ